MAEQVGYGALLRGNRNFRRLFSARLISLFGDWFNTLAILALLRELAGHEASSFAWVLIFKTIPALVVAPLAGVLADRFSRRRILILSDIARAVIVLLMLALSWFQSATALYALVILQTAAAAFFEPARTALLPDLVSRGELVAANAMGAAAWSAMLTLGAAAGGVVTAAFGWQVALLIDALSYLASVVLLRKIDLPRKAQPETTRAGLPGLAQLLGLTAMAEGAIYVARRPRVLSLMLVKSGWCIAGAITLVLTVLGERVYPIMGDPMLGVALLYTARGVGTGLGPIIARGFSRGHQATMERMILAGFLCGSAFYLLVPFAGVAALAALAVALAHLGGATVWVFSTVRLQQLVPSAVRGRVFAAEQGLFTTVLALSTWVYGWLIDHEVAGLRTLVACLGVSLLVPAGLWLIRGARYGWAGSVATVEASLAGADQPKTRSAT